MNIELYSNILNAYYKKYNPKIKKIRGNYEKHCKKISTKKFRKINQKYAYYIKKIVYELINEFMISYNFEYLVSLNGSLARETNTIYSDVDINYLIKDLLHQKEIIEIEDKINYILKKILDFRGKDKIHSMVVYLPLTSNQKYEFITNNQYPICFNNGIIYDKCRKNAEQLMYELYNSTRKIDDVIAYLNANDNRNNLNEWTYCWNIITSKKLEYYYENNRKEFRTKENIIFFIKQVINDINDDNNYLSSSLKYVKNCDLKKIYKSRVLNNIYYYLAIVYRLDHKIPKYTLSEFRKKSRTIDKIFYEKFYGYLMTIQNLQLILDKQNIDLSSHSQRKLNIEVLNQKYYDIFNKKNTVIDLNKKKKEIYEYLLISLKKMEVEYE